MMEWPRSLKVLLINRKPLTNKEVKQWTAQPEAFFTNFGEKNYTANLPSISEENSSKPVALETGSPNNNAPVNPTEGGVEQVANPSGRQPAPIIEEPSGRKKGPNNVDSNGSGEMQDAGPLGLQTVFSPPPGETNVGMAANSNTVNLPNGSEVEPVSTDSEGK